MFVVVTIAIVVVVAAGSVSFSSKVLPRLLVAGFMDDGLGTCLDAMIK